MKLVCSNDEKLIDDYFGKEISNISEYQIFNYESVEQLIDFFSQKTLFQPKRRLIIRGCKFLLAVPKDALDFSKWSKLIDVLSEAKNEEVYLTLNQTNERTLPKEVCKFFTQIEIVKIPSLNKWTVKKYIQECAQRVRIKFDSVIVDFLSNALSCDAGVITNEINKLSLVYFPGMSVDQVKTMVFGPADANMFHLLKKIITGDFHAALRLYDWLVAGSMSPIELLQILISQSFTLKIVSAAIQREKNVMMITNQLHLPTYFFKMYPEVFETFFFKKCVTMFERMCWLEVELKTKSVNLESYVRAHVARFCGLFNGVRDSLGGV